MTTLVRVKRKHTDDPVEALVLSCKRAKKGPTSSGGAKSSASSKSASSEVKNVFRFAGTVAQKDQALPKHIEDVIQRGQLQYKTKGNIPAHVKAKQQQKQTSINNRYRMVAKHRGISLEKQNETLSVSNQDTEADKPKKVSLRKKIVRRLSTKSANRDHSASVVNATAGSSKEVEDEARRLFNIYEVVQENLDDILSNKPAKLASLDDEDDDDDVVMCNNVRMLREKLTISDGDTHRRDTDEYVYDLYYAESSDFDFASEHVVLGLDPYNLSQPVVTEEEEDAGYGQDDDEDSNDENNWKNDYPDEDPDYFNQRHTDMFDEYLDDYRYGELSSDDDFNEYSDNKRHISRMMNYSDEVQNGADSDLEMYG
ncbi:probable RNA polymerase II nuclear localization protein SLC7A6OS [Anneissia japonica]|uniref:probable RNA polymerase II nuclear localization protein SLC7A6OS n=1 Tax=Anneissia japonica TaxID=1529436 RepID=UPI0014258847|nr:probable RNA polymerase II nuclear localization protein SLC7A6OS [Anneissia japonica]